jgi:hypothetical protein
MPKINRKIYESREYNQITTPEPLAVQLAAMYYCESQGMKGILPKSCVGVAFMYARCLSLSNKNKRKIIDTLVEVGWWIETGDSYLIPETQYFKYSNCLSHSAKLTRQMFANKRNYAWKKLAEKGVYCAKCGSTENIEIDHIIPIMKGGDNDITNLQFLCRSCNSKKGTSYEE